MDKLREFGLKWMNIPISKTNRQDFIDDYWFSLGKTDRKQPCLTILNELSRLFYIKKDRANKKEAALYPYLDVGENFYFVGELKKIEE